MGKIVSERRHKHQFKGHTPFSVDRITLYLFRSIFQIPIFVLLYVLIILHLSYQNPVYGFFMTVLLIIIILVISDAISYVVAYWINKTIIFKWGYLLTPKEHKEKLRQSFKYFFYITFRALAIVFAFVWLLSATIFPYFSGWSFLVAWAFISLLCKALATFITDYWILKI